MTDTPAAAATLTIASALHGERLWRRAGERDHTRDGHQVRLAVWQSTCVICGARSRSPPSNLGRRQPVSGASGHFEIAALGDRLDARPASAGDGRGSPRAVQHHQAREALRKDDEMTELYCPRCGGRQLRHGRVMVFDLDEDVGRTVWTVVESGHVTMRLRPSRYINASGARAGLLIAFDCSTCGDGLTLTLADEWGASFEWSFTSDAEDALAERAAGDDAALDRLWPGDEIAQGGEPAL